MSAADNQDFDVENPEAGIDRGQIMLVVLVVLAVIASVVMLFSNSDAAMKVAVLAALWAAFIGLFMVSKYRRIAAEERARSEEQRYQFENQVKNSQVELAEEKAVAASVQDTQLLQDIRDQLVEIRQQLEDLSGRDLGYEPATLTAEASRIREIEAAAEKMKAKQQDSHPITAETEAVSLPQQETEDQRSYTDAPASAMDSRRWTAETSEQVAEPADSRSTAPATPTASKPAAEVEEDQREDPGADWVSQWVAKWDTRPEAEPATEVINLEQMPRQEPKEEQTSLKDAADSGARRFDTGSFAAVKLDAPAKNSETEAEAHGRRRRDERSDAISVADLLANLKKNK
ncbi:DUF6779 domain-containing protein [Corynebacterium sp. H128]|uniref:DUF6779 domain-containing protein n=1 Tax=Corynebacterium sp. H128 TaxID=3133427 RepID=UPI0030AA2B5C